MRIAIVSVVMGLHEVAESIATIQRVEKDAEARGFKDMEALGIEIAAGYRYDYVVRTQEELNTLARCVTLEIPVPTFLTPEGRN